VPRKTILNVDTCKYSRHRVDHAHALHALHAATWVKKTGEEGRPKASAALPLGNAAHYNHENKFGVGYA